MSVIYKWKKSLPFLHVLSPPSNTPLTTAGPTTEEQNPICILTNKQMEKVKESPFVFRMCFLWK